MSVHACVCMRVCACMCVLVLWRGVARIIRGVTQSNTEDFCWWMSPRQKPFQLPVKLYYLPIF